MLKVSNVEVMNMHNAIRGARNPLNSWHRADSYFTYIEDVETLETAPYEFFLGENDLDLAKRLCKAGSDHRKFLRQIIVSVDINAPLYWWKEFDTYKVGTVANSCSTMHKIHAKEFTLDDFSCEHLIDTCLLESVINELNIYRGIYVNYDNQTNLYKKEFSKKDIWWQMIQLLPSSYNQLRTVTLNYEVLRNMYHSRRNHKLDEWHTLCDWIETLPYAKELIIGEE